MLVTLTTQLHPHGFLGATGLVPAHAKVHLPTLLPWGAGVSVFLVLTPLVLNPSPMGKAT